MTRVIAIAAGAWQALLIATTVVLAAATLARAAAKPADALKPMVFYLANGAPNACGEGCDTWIAAEGAFESGTAERLQALIKRIPAPAPPIYFHSPGGNVEPALAIGRLLHKNGMTAGVSRTIPESCAGEREGSDACRAAKRSGKTVAAELRSAGAVCASACVYALIGAKTRLVPPDAALGVHASKVVIVRVTGAARLPRGDELAAMQKARFAESLAELRRYVRDMGIDTRLVDLAFKIPHERVRLLGRNEIAGLGIDRRTFQESSWTFGEIRKKPAISKYFVDDRGSDGKEFHLSVIELGCEKDTHVAVGYVRALTSGETGSRKKIVFTLGSLKMPFSQLAHVAKLEAVDPEALFEARATFEFLDAFDAAAGAPTFEIIESDPEKPEGPSRTTQLSTAGLRDAFGKLRQRCTPGPPKT